MAIEIKKMLESSGQDFCLLEIAEIGNIPIKGNNYTVHFHPSLSFQP